MRKLFIFLVVVVLYQTAGAQGGMSGGGYRKPTMFLREFFTDAVQPKPHMDITGSPFLFDNFLWARLRSWDDQVFDSAYVKLNVHDNKVHFLNEFGEEMQATIGIKEITILDENPTWHGYVYRSGFTAGGSDFFQVLADGEKVQLLKKVRLNIWESRALGEQNKRSFVYEDQLYFAAENTVFAESKKCDAVISGLAEKYHERVQQFVTSNNTRCNKAEDMKKLVDYCNGL